MGRHSTDDTDRPRPVRYVAAALAISAVLAGGVGAALHLADAPTTTVFTAWIAVLAAGAALGLVLGLRARNHWRTS
ncbi:hypothetical protein ABGB17_30405 [Sphaerisporangium sp. B11E5]|uniref:hypothetical protein n=1 Tax=Sphaerisporangium sp. B11E5 TaxID=3153563 RepID=UPI00325C7F4F